MSCFTCRLLADGLKLVEEVIYAFVTLVPARKNTIRSVNGKLQGCIAWAIAVRTAEKIPAGVKDLCDQALYTRARVAGTAI